jgi:HEPN domain-containing protein
MNPLTREWINKAEGDYLTAGRELRVRSAPNYDAVCFHAQQSAEKYLKAILQEHNAPIPRTHILADLLTLCLKINPSLSVLQQDLDGLEGYAVQFRYPGQSADRQEAREAYEAVNTVRDNIRIKLGLK